MLILLALPTRDSHLWTWSTSLSFADLSSWGNGSGQCIVDLHSVKIMHVNFSFKKKRALLSAPSFQVCCQEFSAKAFLVWLGKKNIKALAKNSNLNKLKTIAQKSYKLKADLLAVFRGADRRKRSHSFMSDQLWPLTRHRQALIWAKMAALCNSEPLATTKKEGLIFRYLELSAPQ